METQTVENISISKSEASLLLGLRAANSARLEGYAAGLRDAEIHLARLLAERATAQKEASDGARLQDNS